MENRSVFYPCFVLVSTETRPAYVKHGKHGQVDVIGSAADLEGFRDEKHLAECIEEWKAVHLNVNPERDAAEERVGTKSIRGALDIKQVQESKLFSQK